MWEPYAIPAEIESAATALAEAAESCGARMIVAVVSDGNVDNMSIFDADGTQHFLSTIGGEWHEMVEIDG